MNKLIAQLTFEKFTHEPQTIVFTQGLNIIYGESGTGKSTILDIVQKEKNVTKQNFEMCLESHSFEVYRIYQNPDHQIIASTIGSEITFSGECRQLEPEKLEAVLNDGLAVLPDYIDPKMNPSYLSGGEKEQLNIVTAIDINSEVLLIDDSLSFLSPKSKSTCIQQLIKYSEQTGCIIIWVTSDSSDIMFADRAWTLTLESITKTEEVQINKLERIQFPDGRLSICVDKLSFKYDNSRSIFSDLTLEICNSRSIGLLGENGSGKTTFAGLCFDDLEPTNGSISILVGENPKPRVGYLDQFPEHLVLLRTLSELLSELRDQDIFDSGIEKTFKKRIAGFGIRWEEVSDKKGVDLPWVVLRTVLIILMSHCRFDVLILDEPTFGLGHVQKLKLRSFLNNAMRKMHFMIISHDENFINAVCQNVIDFNDKKIRRNIFADKQKT